MAVSAPAVTYEELLSKLSDVEDKGTFHVARCPLHNGTYARLSLKRDKDGGIRTQCAKGCNHDAVLLSLFPDREKMIRPSMAIIAAGNPFLRPGISDAQVVDEIERIMENAKLLNVPLYQAAQLQHEVLPEPEWAVKGFIPEGLTMLVAHSKIGKTFLAQDVAAAVALGGKAWGKVDVEAGKVIYIDTEGNRRRVQRRLRALLTDEREWPKNLLVSHECVTLDAAGLETLRMLILNNPGTRLLVLDTLNAMRLGRTKGGDLVKEDYDLIRGLRALGEEFHVAILLIHHSSIAAKTDSVNAGAGTHGLAAAASAVLTFSRTRCEHDATLDVTGNDIENEAKWHFTRDTRTGFWTLQGDGAHFMKTGKRQEIFDLLIKSGAMTFPKIHAAIGGEKKALKQVVYRMRVDGDIELNDGFYAVPVTRQ